MMKKLYLILTLAAACSQAAPARAQLALNEIYATPESGATEWLEIYNFSDAPVDLSGWQIAELTSNTIKNYEPIAASEATLSTHGFLVVTPAKLTLNNGGDTIYLFGPDGAQADTITYPKLTSSQACARQPDGSGGWNVVDTPTPGATNVPAADQAADSTASTQSDTTDSTTTQTTTATTVAATTTSVTTATTSKTSATPTPTPSPTVDISWQTGIDFKMPSLSYQTAHDTILTPATIVHPATPAPEASVAGAFTTRTASLQSPTSLIWLGALTFIVSLAILAAPLAADVYDRHHDWQQNLDAF